VPQLASELGLVSARCSGLSLGGIINSLLAIISNPDLKMDGITRKMKYYLLPLNKSTSRVITT